MFFEDAKHAIEWLWEYKNTDILKGFKIEANAEMRSGGSQAPEISNSETATDLEKIINNNLSTLEKKAIVKLHIDGLDESYNKYARYFARKKGSLTRKQYNHEMRVLNARLEKLLMQNEYLNTVNDKFAVEHGFVSLN